MAENSKIKANFDLAGLSTEDIYKESREVSKMSI
jgi:hypothetical protein